MSNKRLGGASERSSGVFRPYCQQAILAVACAMMIFVSLCVGAYAGVLHTGGLAAQQTELDTDSDRLMASPNAHGVPDVIDRWLALRPSQGTDHDQRELAAQEAVTAWTFWMLIVSACSVLITLAGTFLLLRQIRLTRDALRLTNDATVAAAEANTIAREYGEQQLRAWMAPGTPMVERRGAGIITQFLIIFDWKNVGATPALSVAATLEFSVVAAETDLQNLEFDELVPRETESSVVLPGGRVGCGTWELVPEAWFEIQAQGHHLVARISVAYKTIFSDEWRWSVATYLLVPVVSNEAAIDPAVDTSPISFRAVSRHQRAT